VADKPTVVQKVCLSKGNRLRRTGRTTAHSNVCGCVWGNGRQRDAKKSEPCEMQIDDVVGFQRRKEIFDTTFLNTSVFPYKYILEIYRASHFRHLSRELTASIRIVKDDQRP
jgi:hypothetical protein